MDGGLSRHTPPPKKKASNDRWKKLPKLWKKIQNNSKNSRRIQNFQKSKICEAVIILKYVFCAPGAVLPHTVAVPLAGLGSPCALQSPATPSCLSTRSCW